LLSRASCRADTDHPAICKLLPPFDQLFDRIVGALAAQAARQLQLNVAPISNGKGTDLLKRLPQGRIHANGRSFLPSVRKDVYDRGGRLRRGSG